MFGTGFPCGALDRCAKLDVLVRGDSVVGQFVVHEDCFNGCNWRSSSAEIVDQVSFISKCVRKPQFKPI